MARFRWSRPAGLVPLFSQHLTNARWLIKRKTTKASMSTAAALQTTITLNELVWRIRRCLYCCARRRAGQKHARRDSVSPIASPRQFSLIRVHAMSGFAQAPTVMVKTRFLNQIEFNSLGICFGSRSQPRRLTLRLRRVPGVTVATQVT